MSDRLERSTREPAREVTPHADRPDLFDFLEDKWKGRKEGPQTINLCLAFGPGGGTWREDIIHQKEFKKNSTEVPERPALVALANEFFGAAQRHCDQLGKPQGFVVLTFHPTKGSRPYGIHYMKVIPTPGHAVAGGHQPSDENGSVITDEQHRDSLLREQLEHSRETNAHGRFMADANHRYTGQLMAMQQEIIRQQADTISEYKKNDVEKIKMYEELLSKRHEREMEREKQQLLMSLATGGIALLGESMPSIKKALEGRRGQPDEPVTVPEGQIEPSDESDAIAALADELTNEQKCAAFGYPDDGGFVPGILTPEQTSIINAVGTLKAHRGALKTLMSGGQNAITIDQVGKLSAVIGMNRLISLQAIFMRSSHGASSPPPRPSKKSRRSQESTT